MCDFNAMNHAMSLLHHNVKNAWSCSVFNVDEGLQRMSDETAPIKASENYEQRKYQI